MIVIIAQAARGTTSHFNVTTPFNSFLWFTMAAFIVLVWTMNLLLAIMLLRQRMPDQAFAWSLRLGVLISSIGMVAAFFMVRPTRDQAASIASGYTPHIVGAHSVGVADGGPGLPVVGWSTVGGDLRVAHFVGLHALQVLPFLGWLLTRRKGVFVLLAANDRLALVCTMGLGYLGLVLLLIWQALRGQSVVSPDAETIAVASTLAAGVAASMFTTLARVVNRNGKKRVLASAIQILSHQEDV
jgi:prepilin signal peptidase PulO-like enzyme (type II secretory pathway)